MAGIPAWRRGMARTTSPPVCGRSSRGFVKARAAAACSVVVAGCAGGGPLLHGAHALGPGATAQGAGFSGTFATGDVKAAARATRSADRDAAADAIAPGVAPWVGARVGIGGENEAGLTYTGRSL